MHGEDEKIETERDGDWKEERTRAIERAVERAGERKIGWKLEYERVRGRGRRRESETETEGVEERE